MACLGLHLCSYVTGRLLCGSQRTAYERARTLAPGSVDPYLQLGQLLFRAGKPGQALYELGRALAKTLGRRFECSHVSTLDEAMATLKT